MKAMIMAAGVGSRLMPLTVTTPKPMVPLVGKPVMEYSVDLLLKHGITDIIANLHYLPQVIKNHFNNGRQFGVNMEYSYEEKLLGTAGGVKNNQWFLEEDTFVILSGDALTDIDLTEMYKFHKSKKALATIALKPVEDVTQFGVVVTDESNKITAFQEKPKKEDALSNLVNTGIYMFEPKIFELIPKQKFYDFGKDFFPLLVNMKLPFYGWETKDYWSDIGSFDTYKEAQFDLINNKLQFDLDKIIWQNNTVKRETETQISPTAKIAGKAYVGAGSEIEGHTEFFGNVVIGQNCHIGSRCILHNCVVLDDVDIADDVFITDSIIGKGSRINSKVVIHGNCVVADNNTLASQVEIMKGVKIWPGNNLIEFVCVGKDLVS